MARKRKSNRADYNRNLAAKKREITQKISKQLKEKKIIHISGTNSCAPIIFPTGESRFQPPPQKSSDFQETKDTPEPSARGRCCRCKWPFKKRENILVFPCGHCFHKRCSLLWTTGLDECPVCHAKVTTNEMKLLKYGVNV